MTDFKSYISPFSWRYASDEMKKIFSEQHKFELWRDIWVALAQAQQKAGLVSKKELEDLIKNRSRINIQRILDIEKDTKHDVVAAIKEFAEKARVGGGKIHLGATSMDIQDNADTIRLKEAFNLIEEQLVKTLRLFADQIDKYADLPCLGFTHLQPAEPTTVGYRLAFYAQDLLIDYQLLQFAKSQLKAKGLKGAVGTGASYQALLKNTKLTYPEMEKSVMDNLNLEALLISSQVSTKKLEYLILTVLASIGSSLAKFAADLRILQSPVFGEWSEPFGSKQIGSSAMPFKKNPINAEKICSLARYISHLPNIALENASLSYLERTLDDSANRRVIVPEGFLALDEILITSQKILSGLVINQKRIELNLSQYASFSATENILLEAVKKGADRQEIHQLLKDISMNAWQEVQIGNNNPMLELLINNTELNKYVDELIIRNLMKVQVHLGDAPQRAKKLAKQIRKLK